MKIIPLESLVVLPTLVMDPVVRTTLNDPFTPGYGALPQVFAGREVEFADLEVMAQRTRAGIFEPARRIQGVRGIGKTVLLGEYEQWGRAQGLWVLSMAVGPGPGLTARVARVCADLLLEHRPVSKRVAAATLRVLRILAAVGLRYGTPDFHLEYRGAPVQPDRAASSGSAQDDLRRALLAVCELARQHDTGILLLIDEAQNAAPDELAPLLYAVQEVQTHVDTHTVPATGRTVRTSPSLGVVLAGLPNLPDVIGRASATFMTRSTALPLGPLPDAAVQAALPEFSRPHDVEWDADALESTVRRIRGYPYFLHVYGHHCWIAGTTPVITADQAAAGAAAARLTIATFFDERLRRITDLQRGVLDALAALDPSDRSGSRVAELLGRPGTSSIGSTMTNLIDQGLLVRPGRNRYDFALPGMDEHLRT